MCSMADTGERWSGMPCKTRCTPYISMVTTTPGCAADICDVRIAAISNFHEEEPIVGQNIDDESHTGSGGIIPGGWLLGWARARERLRFRTQSAAVENGLSIL